MAWDKEKRNATIQKYQDKYQKRYGLMFSTKKDSEIIAFIEDEKSSGKSPTQIFRELYENKKQHL